MPWYDTNYLHKRQVTIDHTKVSGSSDLSSFPVLVSGTYAYLATVANGGEVQNSSGFDIIFTDSTETTKLDHEIEHYIATTGEIEMWVRIPTLSHTADTVIYMYYDNSTISSSQENATAVWDSNFVAVYHMQQTAGTSNSIKDSTSNANHATPYTAYGSSTVGDISTSSGMIDGAQSFDGANHSIVAPYAASLDINGVNTLSLEAWVKRAATNTVGTIVQHGVGGQGGYTLSIGVGPATVNQAKMTKYGVADITAGSYPADTNWHYVCELADSTGTDFYVDGASNGTTTDSGNFKSYTLAGVHIGEGDADSNTLLDKYWNGPIDEVRISKIRRTDGWVGTCYNGQNSPATFYTVGSEQSQSGVAFAVTFVQVETLSPTPSYLAPLALTLSQVETLAATGGYSTALAVQLSGVETLGGPLEGATTLGGATFAQVETLSASPSYPAPMAATFAGVETLGSAEAYFAALAVLFAGIETLSDLGALIPNVPGRAALSDTRVSSATLGDALRGAAGMSDATVGQAAIADA